MVYRNGRRINVWTVGFLLAASCEQAPAECPEPVECIPTSAPPPDRCEAASDCPGVDWLCERRVCADGVCTQGYAPDGTPDRVDSVPGDCAILVCDGFGKSRRAYSADDAPDDGNPCTVESCSKDGPLRADAPDGTPCIDKSHAGACASGRCVQQ